MACGCCSGGGPCHWCGGSGGSAACGCCSWAGPCHCCGGVSSAGLPLGSPGGGDWFPVWSRRHRSRLDRLRVLGMPRCTAEGDRRSHPGAELMSFTVHRTSDGMLFPQHSSHSSHSSHASHASHVSSVNWPGPPSVPDVPIPIPASPPTPPAVPPTAPASDIATYACNLATNGLGVIQIASELVRLYGIPEDQAVVIAQQALASCAVPPAGANE